MTSTQPPDDNTSQAEATPPLPPAPPSGPPSDPHAPQKRRSGEKSPALATVLAFVPFGLGHLYLGLYQRAVLFFTAFWFSIYLEMPLIAAFFYFFTIFDAFRQAQIIVAHGSEDRPSPARPAQGGLTLGVFLTVVGGVLLLRNWIDLDAVRYFLQDYSPAILVIVGIYLIIAAFRERAKNAEDELESSYGSEDD
jgi:hypothetical protein